MKAKLYTLLAALMLLPLAACNNDNEPKEEKASIVGTWKLVALTGYDEDEGRYSEVIDYVETYTFNADGTFTFQEDNITDSGTYTVSGNVLTTRSNSQYAYVDEYTIRQLDETTLVLYDDDSDEEEEAWEMLTFARQ